MWDFIKLVIGALVPPRGDASPERAYRWRITVATLLVAIGGLSVANTVAMFGLWPLLFAGFAHADVVVQQKDVTALQHSVDALSAQLKQSQIETKQSQIATLGQQIYNLHVMECNARKARNFEAAKSHADKLEELRFSFRLLAQYDYPLRDCAEL